MASSAPTITAEGLFTVSYGSTRLGNIATGFNMTLTGPPGSVSGKTTVSISNGKDTEIWGSKNGIVLSVGDSMSRTSEGQSTVVTDPIFDFFQKIVYFQNASTTYAEKIKSSGALIILDSNAVETALYETLGAGKIKEFIDMVISPPSHIKINYSKTANSPLVKALQGGSTVSGILQDDSVFAASKTFINGQYMSVGDIFNQFICPLGLELYWEKDGDYSLEPPRLTVDNPVSIKSIGLDEIVSLRINTDPYNAPDVIIPNMVHQESLGVMSGDDFILRSLSAGVLKDIGGKNVKVSTYDIPSFLVSTVKEATRVHELSFNSYEGGSPYQSSDEAASKIAAFFGAHARKSSLYAQKTGECVMSLSPAIVRAYNWYKIAGTLCFVSEIRHEISRGSAVTILTVAGVHDKSILTNDLVSNVKSSLPARERKFVDKLKKEAEDETKKTTKKIKSGIKVTQIKPGLIKKKDMSNIFSDTDENTSVVRGTAVEGAVNFDPGDE